MKKIIGVDPDVDKSGFAIWMPESQSFEKITLLDFYSILEYFSKYAADISMVVVEAGWLNTGNFHLSKQKSIRAAAKTGENTGRNFQRGIDITEAAAFYGIPCRLSKPTAKNSWKNSEEMFRKITGVKGGNPEMRDAAMLVYGLKQ